MVQLTRMRARPAGRAVRQARGVQPGRQRQGPDRRGDDRGRRARGPDRARADDDRRGDERQHRHRAGVRLRGQGLRPRADAAAGHEPRARGRCCACTAPRVEVTESLGGMNEAVEAARALATRDDVFLPDQFSNPANPEIHRRTTGPEMWEALDGRIDVFVAGVGTGGHDHRRRARCSRSATRAAGSSRSSRAARPCSPGGPPGPHKIQGIGAGFVPAVLNRELLDEVIAVDDEDAIETARLLARREGVLAGISCGAAVWAALEVARAARVRGARIATILPDSGERYVSTPFFAP